jgi:GR25 family glycosyltransferase involved in LPS biosynthesis
MDVFHTITNGDENRIKKTKEAFEHYHLKNEFHYFMKHPTNGRLGCFLSHIKLFKYAKKHGMEYIFISEDNLSINHKINKRELYDFMHQSSSWNIIILGGWLIPFVTFNTTPYSSIFKTSSIHGTSAYVIHKRFYEPILKQYSTHQLEHIDAYLMSQAQPHAYIVSPLMFYRNNCIPTTNSYYIPNQIVDYYYYFTFSKTVRHFFEYYSIHYESILLSLIIIISMFFIVKKHIKN